MRHCLRSGGCGNRAACVFVPRRFGARDVYKRQDLAGAAGDAVTAPTGAVVARAYEDPQLSLIHI